MARHIPIQIGPGLRGRVTARELRRAASFVLHAEDVAPEVEVEIALADVVTIRDLNRLYRGKDEPTDVLSFAEADAWMAFTSPDGQPPSLGEVVICLPVAEAQAEASAKPVAGQVAHLLTHGLLHLLGYDHEAGETESQRMQAREDELLAAMGYGGQYEHGH